MKKVLFGLAASLVLIMPMTALEAKYDYGNPSESGTAPETSAAGVSFTDMIRGKFLLAVQDHGELWYVKPLTLKRTYIGSEFHVLKLMQSGLGISNENLEKIPIGILADPGRDADGDGLSDELELKIGLSTFNADSDGDGVSDAVEVQNHTNARGSGSLEMDGELAIRLGGYIVLQIENGGEAWYIHPDTNQRFYLGSPKNAFWTISQLALGITNAQLNRIAVDKTSF